MQVKLPHTMQTFAAIDIGSNSCRLKIARVQQHQLKVLHEDREVTRLGASVFESGVISPDAMAGTLVALKRFYRAVKLHTADRVRAVATSALRDARNAQAFLAWVKSETGLGRRNHLRAGRGTPDPSWGHGRTGDTREMPSDRRGRG